MFNLLVKLSAILLVTCNVSFAILAGPSQATGGNGTQIKSERPAGDESANTTFYYEANEFLSSPKKLEVNETIQVNQKKEFKPASMAMTSGRNGRMLDLDALMGDFAASQANRKQSGQRQSRYLAGPDNLALAAAGKKLHIQGFIPIVGVKDIVGNGDEAGEEAAAEALEQQASKLQKLRALQQQSGNTGNELPYAQSSIGHASYNVQRYLTGGESQFNQQPEVGQQQQVDSKSSGIIESLKRPIKKMAGLGVGEGQQNCLCVPFYMCKNGFIVESSLGRSQIQQMLLQQQQQANQQQIEMKSGQLIAPPPPQAKASVAYGADSYAQVDERSLDKDIITMTPLVSSSAAFVDQNQTAEFGDGVMSSEATAGQPLLNQTQLEELMGGNGSSSLELAAGQEYSQEILGRMLGLKSKASNNLQRQQAPVGACGLLRTCCGIPSGALTQPAQQYEPAAAYSSVVRPQQQQFQASSLQRYQPVRPVAGSQTHYGLPSQPLAQISRAPPQQSLYEQLPPMAHRTSQLVGLNRFQPATSMVAQYARANPSPMQLLQQQKPLNQFAMMQQQQQQQSFPVPVSLPVTSAVGRQNAGGLQPANSLLGSRKILDGRCGLRQAAGITGRVQNLQYPESSADFGEYPAQAAILKRLTGSDSLFVCGGTLISQYWVATAAHCIKKHSQSDLKVRLGEWDVHRDDEFYPFIEKEIRDVVIHPEFVAGNLVNDIALLRLESPVDISLPHVNPACLPTIDESFSRQHCWVTGWGKDSFGQKGSFQAVLKEVELPVVGQGECEQALRSTRLGPHYRLHSGFICAGGENGKDACEGDGGSGLYCVQDGIVKVAGLVSWGIGCGQAGVPGVYVNMAHYRPWIENIISIDEDIYSPQSNLVGGSNSLISERTNNNLAGDTNSTLLLQEANITTTTSPAQ